MIEVNWCLPMFDDPVPGQPARPPHLEHLIDVAQAAQVGGFGALLLGAGWGQKVEAFTTAAALLQNCTSIRALIAVRPGFYHPAVTAKLAATIDQHSGGRVLLNVVTGGVPSDLARYGDTADHDTRYERTEEFLRILSGLILQPGTPLTHNGRFFCVRDAVLDYPLAGDPAGRIYFGGASEPARTIAAAYADTYLMWGVPLAEARSTVTQMRRRAAEVGRQIRCGLRINIIARADTQEAWAVARSLLQDADPAALARMRAIAGESDSVGQQHMFDLAANPDHAGTATPGPGTEGTYWSGLGQLRVGSGTALVGSYTDVAAALRRYADAGIDSFILAGTPHLEECRRVARFVLPLLATVEAS